MDRTGTAWNHETRVGGGGATTGTRGFGFVETLIALALLSVTVLGVGQMIITGVYVNEASADMTSVTAIASQRMESLRATDYDTLVAGGNLAASVNGYFEDLDLDNVTGAEITARWQVTDIDGAFQLDVRVIGPANASGGNRDVRLTSIMADR